MIKYKGYIDNQTTVILDSRREDARDIEQEKIRTCSHGFTKTTCRMCSILLELEKARPAMDAYISAVEYVNSRRRYHPYGDVTEKDVWPQWYDRKTIDNSAEVSEMIAIKCYIADIVFKRNIKLSNGIMFDRGMSGYLLLRNAGDELLKCVDSDLLREDYMELMERAEKNNHHWVYAGGFLACIPQTEEIKRTSRKTKEEIIKEVTNFKILKESSPPLF